MNPLRLDNDATLAIAMLLREQRRNIPLRVLHPNRANPIPRTAQPDRARSFGASLPS